MNTEAAHTFFAGHSSLGLLMEAKLFFTFFGLDAIHQKRIHHIKVATVGNPVMHIPTLIGGLPGMSGVATHLMCRKTDELDRELRHAIPDVYKGCAEFHHAAFAPGQLDAKTKELIALAYAAFCEFAQQPVG